MGNTLIGSLLCVGGSWGSNLANVSLKQLDNANDKLELEGKERMGLYNYYNYKYVGCYALSQIQDQTSLLLISQTLWAAISCLDVFWYSFFMCIYVGDPLEPLEMIPLLLIMVGIGFTVFNGAEEEEKTAPGYQRILDANPDTVLAVIPAFCAVLVLMYGFVYWNYKNVKNNPDKYPPGYMPPPLSLYNCAGIFVNGASTGLFASSMFVLNNSALYEDCMFGDPSKCTHPDCWWATLIVGFGVFLPLTALSFATDWFAARELHIITVVPASLIVSTLVQFMLTKTFYDDQYTNAPLFFVGVWLMVLALGAYVVVEEYIWRRDHQDDEETVERKNMDRFDWWFQWMNYCPCEYRIYHTHLVKKSEIEAIQLKEHNAVGDYSTKEIEVAEKKIDNSEENDV